jgi:predicted MPP superfamily phosphohydrolase
MNVALHKDNPHLPSPTEPASRFNRRKFLRRLVAGGAAGAAGAFLYTWRIEPHWVEIVRRDLPIARLPSDLIGARLVQLSDLHAGPFVDQSFLLNAAEGAARLQPDLIVLTGDFMSCMGQESVPQALEVVERLPSPSAGRFAVLGNHDYAVGWRRDDVADKLAAGLQDLGVRVLRNEVADVAGMQLAGVDDFWTDHFDPEQTLAELDADRPALALCHNPDGVDDPAWQKYRGWILAGHTHGGQCKAPFLRPPLLPVRNKRYVAGEYDLAGGRRLYINRGLGYLRRVRFNCRPEITLFTLQRA